MRYLKIYRDENYPDPVPGGHCIICGKGVFPGDAHYRTDEGLICDDGSVGRIETERVGKIRISCLLAYPAESCLEDEAAAAIGVERVVGV